MAARLAYITCHSRNLILPQEPVGGLVDNFLCYQLEDGVRSSEILEMLCDFEELWGFCITT